MAAIKAVLQNSSKEHQLLTSSSVNTTLFIFKHSVMNVFMIEERWPSQLAKRLNSVLFKLGIHILLFLNVTVQTTKDAESDHQYTLNYLFFTRKILSLYVCSVWKDTVIIFLNNHSADGIKQITSGFPQLGSSCMTYVALELFLISLIIVQL